MLPYWDIEELKTKYSNGCEVGFTIAEGTKEKDLIDFLRHYANNEKNLGGNIMSSKIHQTFAFYYFLPSLNKRPHSIQLIANIRFRPERSILIVISQLHCTNLTFIFFYLCAI